MSHDADLVNFANADVSTNAVANINEQTTIHNLREIEHVDSNGNLIGMFLVLIHCKDETLTFKSSRARLVESYTTAI